MQITKFDLSCQSIEKVCSRVEYRLRWQKNFEPIEREKFNNALKSLSRLLHQDSFIRYQNLPLWHIAYRIVRLNAISDKIKKISNIICQSNGPKYFCHKMNQGIIPSLTQRMHDLNLFALSTQRLPFSGKEIWGHFLYEMNKQISVLEIAHIHAIEKEFFHLIGNGLRADLLQHMNFTSLSGNFEIKAYLSWIYVLSFAIQKEKNENTKKVFEFLLAVLNKAVPLAAKQSYFSCCYLEDAIKDGFSVNSYPDTTYYEAVASLDDYDQTLLYPLQKMNQELFAQQYNLNACRIPFTVLENDMAWDMVETISQMKQGEVRVFSLGVAGHRVVVQLTCEVEESSTQNSSFRYTIFNTGGGIRFHTTAWNNSSLFGYPLTFHHVPGKCLDYFFCSKLINKSLFETNIDCFYEYHISLFVHVGGIPDLNYGKWYTLQNYETCTHSSLEAWITSYLNPMQMKKLEIFKTEISIIKQSQVIDLIWAANQSLNGPITVKNSLLHPLNNKSWIEIDLSQKLKESLFLFHLGMEYLNYLKMQDNITEKSKSNDKL